jgi:signal transduction histidine kinase
MAQEDPSTLRLPQSPAWVMVAVFGMGVLLAAFGLARGLTGVSATGLVGAVAGMVGLWLDHRSVLQAARERQALLLDLNRNLDEQVSLRTQRLMKTIEDLESFNQMVTHDLNSPLSGLIIGLEILTKRMVDEPDPEKKMLVKGIFESAARMQELVHDLRQLALISGRIPAIQAVDLSQHALLVLQNLREREPARNVAWRIEPGLIVHGDPSLLRIALENLLGNAWKFTLGKNSAEIRVARGSGEPMNIEIQDNGCGFDPAQADRLFQPFFRMRHDKEYHGSGLGLSIVKRVMSRHGGSVSATSRPGQGATFRLEFSQGPSLH